MDAITAGTFNSEGISYIITTLSTTDDRRVYSTWSNFCTTMAVAAPPPLQTAATPYSPGWSW